MFYDILERKNSSTDFIKKKLKKSKNWDFFKGVSPLFWSKIDNFSMFFFRQNGPRKFVLRYFRKKKRFSRLNM